MVIAVRGMGCGNVIHLSGRSSVLTEIGSTGLETINSEVSECQYFQIMMSIACIV